MSITATVENNTIRLPEGTHFPNGTKVIIEPLDVAGESGDLGVGQGLMKFAGIADDLPSDLARNLDHYVHGHAKQP